MQEMVDRDVDAASWLQALVNELIRKRFKHFSLAMSEKRITPSLGL